MIACPYKSPNVIPRQRNGPKANVSFLSAFPVNSRPAAQIPPKKNPRKVEIKVIFHPKNNPQAAISLMSPPPKAPGITKVMSNRGRLTQSAPDNLAPIPGPSMVNQETTAKLNIARWHPSAISMVSISRKVTTVKIAKNAKIVNAFPIVSN